MLKKLAKYGNSTALVIDKAILELLNIDDATLVKLHTDGKSLTITPVKPGQAAEKVSYENNEALAVAAETLKREQLALCKPLNEVDNAQAHQEFTAIFVKHGSVFRKFFEEDMNSPEFQSALAEITAKYDPLTQSAEFVTEYKKLKSRFCPAFGEMEKELATVAKKYEPKK